MELSESFLRQWVADEEAGMRMALDAQIFTGKATHHIIISGLGRGVSGGGLVSTM